MAQYDTESGEILLDRRPDYANISAYFPLEEMRPGQLEILPILGEFLEGPKKFLCLELPVGSGKSPLALMMAQASKSAYVVTANKILQDQYLRDFSHLMQDLKGRRNYQNCTDGAYQIGTVRECEQTRPCPLHKKFPDSKGCLVSSVTNCSPEEPCEYHQTLDEAVNSPITSFNIASFLAFLNFVNKFSQRNLLIIDESHNIPAQLTNFVELNIRLSDIQNLELSPVLPDYQKIEFYGKFLESIHEKGQSILKDRMHPIHIDQKMLDRLESMVRRIDFFRKLGESEHGTDQFALLKEYDPKSGVLTSVIFKPVVVSTLANQYMFKHAKKVVFLSATILDFRTFGDMLGIHPSEIMTYSQKSFFPKERRPIYTSCAGAALNYNNLDSELPNVTKLVKQILAHHKEHKGIIHGVTYKICEYLHKHLRDHRILFPKNAAEQRTILDEHEQTDRPTVLLSPSMNEGVDLRGDTSRFQILVKVPYPSLGDPIVQRRKEIYPNYYSMQTALTIVQSCGRSIRSHDDWAFTYVTDGGFMPFLQRNRGIIPQWFWESIV